MKKIFVLFFALILFQTQAYCVDEWAKSDPAGTRNAADIDSYVTVNNSALDRLLIGYKRGMGLNYSTAATLSVLTGEIAIPNSGGSVVRFRRLTSNLSVGWADIDTGVEASATTYYVYLIADTDATAPTAKISASSSAPSGITYYIKIGQFYNDGSSNITDVVSYRPDYGTDYPDVLEGWINFDASTATINDQYNVSSISDNGTGDFTINWATSFSNANYSVVTSGKETGSTFATIVSLDETSPLTTSSARIQCRDDARTPVDPTIVCVVASGDRT